MLHFTAQPFNMSPVPIKPTCDVCIYTDEQAFAYDMRDNGDINVALLGTRVHCTTPPAENAG